MIEQYTDDSGLYENTGSQYDTKKILYLLGAVILLIIVSVFFISKSPSSGQNDICGNGVCDTGENCRNCLKDCSCKADEICKNKVCTKKEKQKEVCGNGVCGTGEDESNCCNDCPCTSQDQVCNQETRNCESKESKVRHGDGICDVSENCWDHQKDCKCDKGEFCSKEEKKCVKPECGNGKCEQYENSYTCCLDCECILPGEFCNEDTKKCETPEMKLSDEKALEIAKKYFEDKEIDAGSAVVGRVSAYNEELIKVVNVPISHGRFLSVGVTEDGRVIELPTT